MGIFGNVLGGVFGGLVCEKPMHCISITGIGSVSQQNDTLMLRGNLNVQSRQYNANEYFAYYSDKIINPVKVNTVEKYGCSFCKTCQWKDNVCSGCGAGAQN